MRRRGVGGPGRGPARMTARRMATRMAARMHMRRRRRRRRRRIILVGGMVALGTAAVHKYSKNDVERIEEKTGQPAEELTDEQLAQAAKELGIDPQEMSDEEWDEMEAADAEDGGDDDDYIEELERLADLRDKGIITDDEFETKKKELLGL